MWTQQLFSQLKIVDEDYIQQKPYNHLIIQNHLLKRGIPIQYLAVSKLDIDLLTCYLCKCILWKPITCNQSNCFTNFCQLCLNDYNKNNIITNQTKFISSSNNIKKQSSLPIINVNNNNNNNNNNSNIHNSNKSIYLHYKTPCPKCINPMQRTNLPLIKNILSNIKLKCFNHQCGCRQIIDYEYFDKHIKSCEYQSNFFIFNLLIFQSYDMLRMSIEIPQKQCRMIDKQCQKCKNKYKNYQFITKHSEYKCLQRQLQLKNQRLQKYQKQTQILQNKVDKYQSLINKLIKGQYFSLNINFYTSFPNNFRIYKQSLTISLIKASYNSTRQKHDFLHFYLTPSIKSLSLINYQWKILLKTLKGNLLIGICSSTKSISVDLVINKYGEIKKKQINQNKYKLIRKSDITFSQNDIVKFKYISRDKVLKIYNQSKKIQCYLHKEEIQSLGEEINLFYSMDTLADSLKFN